MIPQHELNLSPLPAVIRRGPSKMDLMLAVFACGREEDQRLHDVKFYFDRENHEEGVEDSEKPTHIVVEVMAVEKRGEEAPFKEPNVLIETRSSWYVYGYILFGGVRKKWVVLNYDTHDRSGLAWGFPLTEEQLANQGYPDMESKHRHLSKRRA